MAEMSSIFIISRVTKLMRVDSEMWGRFRQAARLEGSVSVWRRERQKGEEGGRKGK